MGEHALHPDAYKKSGNVGIRREAFRWAYHANTEDEMSSHKRSLAESPMVATHRGRGRVTLPKAARDRLSLAEGDRVLCSVGRGIVEFIPVELVTRADLWSMTGPVRDRIEAAERDLTAERSVVARTPTALARAIEALRGGQS